MTTFRSRHLIVNRTLADDRRHVRDFIDATFFHRGGICTLLLKWTPSTNANIFSRYYAHCGKTLNILYIYYINISTANDFNFTVFILAENFVPGVVASLSLELLPL